MNEIEALTALARAARAWYEDTDGGSERIELIRAVEALMDVAAPNEKDAVPIAWGEVCPDDRVQNKAGVFMRVVSSERKDGGKWVSGRKEPAGQRVVIDMGGGRTITRTMPKDGSVNVLRGEVGRAVDILRAGFGEVEAL